MITSETLSAEYRPAALLSKEEQIVDPKNPTIPLPKDIEASKKYLDAYAKKLKQFKPATRPEDAVKTASLSDDAIERLRKVGAKSFVPKANSGSPDTGMTQTFSWDHFKNEQKRSIEKLSTKISQDQLKTKVSGKLHQDPRGRTEEEIEKQQTSKFGVYGGWYWVHDDDPNKFCLINSDVPSKKITVHYDEQNGKIDVKTAKQNMQDDKILAIMLEITRNIQRHSGTHEQPISTFGLNSGVPYDQQITKKLDQGINALNEGVAKAKATADKNKKLNIHKNSN